VRLRLSYLPHERVAALIEPVAERAFEVVGNVRGEWCRQRETWRI
jgi:hypothetical protein